jgi:hypothetical protein
MNDLIERLRHAEDPDTYVSEGDLWNLCGEAADEIEALRAERRAIAAQIYMSQSWAINEKIAYEHADRIIQHDLDNPPGWEEKDYKALYHELIYQVEQKHPDESRHETAKRLIQNSQRCVPCNPIGGKELQN